MAWRCECGREFEELGDRKGYGQAFRHRIETKHRIAGLFDSESGETLVKGESLRSAIKRGYIKAKVRSEVEEKDLKAQVKAKEKPVSPAKVVVRPEVVEIGPEVIVLHAMAKARFPEDYGDSTLEEFLEDCVMGFFSRNAQVFGLPDMLGKRHR